MPNLSRPLAVRLAWCGLPLAVGAAAALLLLALAGAPARTANAAAAAAPSTTVTFPGCGTTIQGCIDSAAPGSTLVISAGTYITSLTLSKAVSLTGVSSATVILQALTDQRVLTVTGAAINDSVIISGLTIARGHAAGVNCDNLGCGGGVLVTGTAQPRIQAVIFFSNTAGAYGGGVYAGNALTLTDVQFVSNSARADGGGLFSVGALKLSGGLFWSNECTGICLGGGAFVERYPDADRHAVHQ